MDKKKAIEALAAHALSTLPDSRSASIKLLQHVIFALPKGVEVRIEAQSQLHLLLSAERSQQQFNLDQNGGNNE